jgi:hypothetical protein
MNPILMIVWAVLTACFLALLVYRGQLTRYEEEQLFLGDEPNPEEQFQKQIVHKIERITPIIRLVGGAAGLVTACAVGVYVYEAWQRLQ